MKGKLAVVLGILLGFGGLAQVANAGSKQRVAVAPVAGAKAVKLRKGIERALRKRHRVVPNKRVRRWVASDALDVDGASSDDWARLGQSARADLVVTTEVEKLRARRYRVAIAIRAAATGEVLAQTQTTARRLRLGRRDRRKLAKALKRARRALKRIAKSRRRGSSGGQRDTSNEDDDFTGGAGETVAIVDDEVPAILRK